MGRLRDYTAEQSGCGYYDNCLTCPRERCIFEEEGRAPCPSVERRMATAREMFSQGKGLKEVMGELQISRKTAYRYKALAGEGHLTI